MQSLLTDWLLGCLNLHCRSKCVLFQTKWENEVVLLRSCMVFNFAISCLTYFLSAKSESPPHSVNVKLPLNCMRRKSRGFSLVCVPKWHPVPGVPNLFTLHNPKLTLEYAGDITWRNYIPWLLCSYSLNFRSRRLSRHNDMNPHSILFN